MTYFKITNRLENHKGFQYKDGLNILDKPFEEEGSCVPGGLYFSDAKNILSFIDYGVYLREITLPESDPDFKMVEDPVGKKWRANKIILGERRDLSDVSTFEYLFSLGADLRIDNDLALCLTARDGYTEVVRFLIEKGSSNGTAIEFAAKYGHLEIVRVFVEKFGKSIKLNIDQAIDLATRMTHFHVVAYLAENGADVNMYDDFPLRMAVRYGNMEAARSLVANGANIHACNDYPIITAVTNNDLQMSKFLIESGADRDIAMEYALRHGDKPMQKFLEEIKN